MAKSLTVLPLAKYRRFTKAVNFRVSLDEWKLLAKQARLNKVSLSEYIRQIITERIQEGQTAQSSVTP